MIATKPAPRRFPLGRHDAGDGAERLDAATIIERLLDACEGHVAIACSFQRESAVLIELMAQAGATPRLFTLDTHLLFPETYETWRAVEARYGIEVEVFQGPSLRRQAALFGDRLWERDPDACCRVRKVGPLAEALEGLEAWMSGLRREQSLARATTAKLAWDGRHGLWKACPIADWSARDVAGFIDQPRSALQQPPRSRLRLDRMRAVHAARRGSGGALGGQREDRMRAALALMTGSG